MSTKMVDLAYKSVSRVQYKGFEVPFTLERFLKDIIVSGNESDRHHLRRPATITDIFICVSVFVERNFPPCYLIDIRKDVLW